MFDLARYAELRRLLEAVERADDALLANERDAAAELARRYAAPGPVEATDLTCLEVILRNVEIRKGYRFDPKAEAGRVIEPHVKRGSKGRGRR